jgi:hypothetical protein
MAAQLAFVAGLLQMFVYAGKYVQLLSYDEHNMECLQIHYH